MKDIKKFFLLIICCFININFCYAFAMVSTSVNYPSDGSSGGGVPGDTDGDGKINGQKSVSDGYQCYYNYYMNSGNNVRVDGFNQNNKSIISEKVTPNELIKAGTSIGISIVEVKKASLDYKVKEVKKNICEKVTTCTLTWNNGSAQTVDKDSSKHKECYNSDDGVCEASCGGAREKCSTKYSKEGEKYWKECEEKAKADSAGLADSYIKSQSYKNMKLLNPNDASIIDYEDDGSVTVLTDKVCDDCGDGSCSCTHIYTPKSVCMNKLTSDVFYDEESCGTDEFKIENDIVDGFEHFHYFVPMNVTNGSFSLILSESGERQENEWCKKAINDNPTNFYDFFVGVRANGETFRFSDNITTAINSLDYGCYNRSEIRIPVSNGLYNVEDNKIKGYNLYVKNVDEYNPFPNPVTKLDSLWFDWYESNYSGGSYNSGGSPNIRESFSEEPSYKLENVNAKKIRKLNSNLGNYLKVSLNESGSSDFIRNEIVFNKVANPNTYYKLGCGPINSVETIIDGTDIITNPLYQEGCK